MSELPPVPPFTARTRAMVAAAILLLLAGGYAQLSFGTFGPAADGANVVGTDDAYISFRYARNIVDGHGPVFNPGERVEGYSNPLFVALMVPGIWLLSPDGAYAWSVGLNAAFLVLTLLVLAGAAYRARGGPAGAAAAMVFAASPVIWVWMGAGLETAQVLLLQVSLWALAIEPPSRLRSRLLPAIAVALAVSRPDGLLVPAVVAAYLWWSGDRATARRLVLAGVAALVVMTAWRLSYYGAALPNTYYAKVDGELVGRVVAGARQLLAVAATAGLLPLIVVLFGIWPWDHASGRRHAPPLSALIALTLCAYFLFVGGDVFQERFLLPLIPLGIYEVLVRFGAGHLGRLAVTAAGLMLVLASPLGARDDQRFAYTRARHDTWLTLGSFLRTEAPGAMLAIDGAGKVPYVSELVTIDMLGLNDSTLARGPVRPGAAGHRKYSADYVFSRRPDVIAAWVATDDFDLEWGLSRVRYEAEGYRLAFLVNATRFPRQDAEGRPRNVVDLSDLPADARLKLFVSGYRYAVLVRRANPSVPGAS